jgi:hypothetical protein
MERAILTENGCGRFKNMKNVLSFFVI